jgi:Uma2 family endonuclease
MFAEVKLDRTSPSKLRSQPRSILSSHLSLQLRRFSISEFERLNQLGIFAPGERLELIEGEIISMAAKGTKHVVYCSNLIEQLSDCLRGVAILRCQDPINLASYSQPEPDLAIAKLRLDKYLSAHPNPDDLWLVIEIADSSLGYDRAVKIPLYAEAAIPHYWIFNLVDQQLETHSEPFTKSNGEFDYAHKQVFLPQTVVQLPFLDNLSLDLRKIFTA